MPEYTYIARAKNGTTEQDVITAYNEKSVVEALRARGLMPTTITEIKKKMDLSSLLGIFNRIKLIDKITFIKNLSVMIKSGLPVSRSLKIMSEQTINKKFAGIVAEVARAVESGSSLADSLSKHPEVFSSLFVSMIQVGEVSGNLEGNMKYLSEQLQRDYDLVSKTKSAMTYPIIVMIALVLVGFAMFTFVLPKLTATFKEFNADLPAMTKLVIAMVDVFSHYGIFLLIGFVAFLAGFMYWRKTEPGKAVIHQVVLIMPVFSGIVKKVNTARFVGVFASLLRSGMPIVDSLDVSANVVGNIYYKKAVKEVASKVKVGSSLGSSFRKYPHLFDPLVIQIMEVGEESGTTDAILSEVAAFYEAEVSETMKNMSSILEPVIMMVVGVVVGFLAVALISPIYSIAQNVG
jgi:type IV pilus assembly protein PilC